MSAERFQELQSIYLDGDPSPSEVEELATLLREDPTLVDNFRQELHFLDLMEQAVKPERTFEAFVNGLETRVRAERTADEFMSELLPKLKAVDEAQIAPVPMEKVHAFPTWQRAALATAAAAAAVLGALAFLDPTSLFESGSATVADSGDTQPVVSPHTSAGAVWEWQNGDILPVGKPIKIESGVALINIAPGKSITVEGPAEFMLKSASEGVLLNGKLVAQVASEDEAFKIEIAESPDDMPTFKRAPSMVIEIAGGATGITKSGDQIQTSVFSQQGGAAIEFERKEKNLGPFESAVARTDNTRPQIDTAPFDLSPYQAHFPLLSSVSDFSDTVRIGMPGVPDPFQGQNADSGSIKMHMERDWGQLKAPLLVDVVPQKLEGMEQISGGKKELLAGDHVRSYLLQLDTLEGKPDEEDPEYINASITFEDDIVGLSTSQTTLSQSDGLAGHASQKIDPEKIEIRGLESGDEVSIREDGRTLDVRMKANKRQLNGELRVFVRSE